MSVGGKAERGQEADGHQGRAAAGDQGLSVQGPVKQDKEKLETDAFTTHINVAHVTTDELTAFEVSSRYPRLVFRVSGLYLKVEGLGSRVSI